MKKEELRSYLLENVNVLIDIVNEINSWSGELDYLDFQENDEEFFNCYFSENPMEAVRAAQYGDYNYSDEYVRFDAYGNLESFTEYEMQKTLGDNVDNIIESLEDNIDEIDINDDVIISYFEDINK